MISSPLLRTGDGRRFLAAQLMDSLSAGISLVALPWLVLDVGGSRTAAGGVFLAGTVPLRRPRPARRATSATTARGAG